MNRFRVNRCCLQNAMTFSDLAGMALVQTEGFCFVALQLVQQIYLDFIATNLDCTVASYCVCVCLRERERERFVELQFQ